MHILMIAPEPFFEPRGTPFSEFHRIRALTDLGHTVDLVTYPFGCAVDLPGLRVFRCVRPPFVRRVRVGPSFAKVPLDLALAATAVRRALTGRYDAVHSHEEGGAIGVPLALALRVPHLYDMHSSLPQQLVNFTFSRSRLLHSLFRTLERLIIRRSRVVIVICPHLAEVVRRIHPSAHTVLIENAPGPKVPRSADAPAVPLSETTGVRAEFGVPPSAPLVVYTGTFEAYQGLDLLMDAAREVSRAVPDVSFLLVGGRPEQVERMRAEVRRLGIERVMIFSGERPAEMIPSILEAADVLVSPRSTGTNTPLKIYQYLRSGRPIVATRLLTHTQVLDGAVAILTEPSPEAFAAGIVHAISEPSARTLGAQARRLAETKYSYEAYLDRTRQACEVLFAAGSPQVAGGIV